LRFLVLALIAQIRNDRGHACCVRGP
jgi:hypothetical protein